MPPDPPPLPALPLIVTLTLDAAAQAWFDALRTAHFPPERLVVGAHVTMFHALPGAREKEVAACLSALCAGVAPFGVEVAGLRFLGRGVAFALQAPLAVALRRRLAETFAGELSPQDRAGWSPHVTVQNKVDAQTARQTYALLSGRRPPSPVEAIGLSLWRYQGGPWSPVQTWRFQ